METITRERLIGEVAFSDNVRGIMFGQLVARAAPIVAHYHGDFYYDARWISEHVNGPTEFFYGWDNCGTAIGTDSELAALSRRNVMRVSLEIDHARDAGRDGTVGTWYVAIEVLKSEAAQ